jgi:integrase
MLETERRQKMPTMLLTDISVRALQGSASNPKFFDTKTPGFGIRCGLKRKTWVVMRGKNRELITLGHYPDLSLSDARAKAKKLLATEPVARTVRITFAEARDEFLEQNYQGSKSAWPGIVKLILKKHFKGFDEKQLTAISDEDIQGALDAIHKPSARLHAYRAVRTFFRWTTKPPRRYLKHSPMEGYEAPGKDGKRSRILTDAELVSVWKASGEGSRRVFRLLILWGTRSAETTHLARGWRENDVLTIPGEYTKNGRDHAIPILTRAETVLATSPPGDWYFPGQKGDTIKPGSLHALRRDVQKDSGVKGWGAHDLRRTFRSNMARLGVPKNISEILLNHAPATLDEIYDGYTYLPEKREALAKYEAFLLKLLADGTT